jgi:hypothetical protein
MMHGTGRNDIASPDQEISSGRKFQPPFHAENFLSMVRRDGYLARDAGTFLGKAKPAPNFLDRRPRVTFV